MGIINYIKTVWADRNVQYPNRYTDELSNVKTFTASPGTVTEAGTTVTASRMNNIEDAIEDLDIAVGNTWIKLSTIDLAISGSTITLPTGYKEFKLILEEVAPSSGFNYILGIYFNNNTTAQYNFQFSASATYGNTGNGQTYISMSQPEFGSSAKAYGIINIINSSDKYKMISFALSILGGMGSCGSGVWMNTAEATFLDFNPSLTSGRIILYGIK